MNETDETGLPKENDFLKGLLANYAPKDLEFEVALPKGEKLTFREFGSYGEYMAFRAESRNFAIKTLKLKEELTDPSTHPFFSRFVPQTAEDVVTAYTIHAMSVEPKFDIPTAFGLLPAFTLVGHIMDAIEAHSMAYMTPDAIEVTEQKKGSKPTSPPDPSPSSID